MWRSGLLEPPDAGQAGKPTLCVECTLCSGYRCGHACSSALSCPPPIRVHQRHVSSFSKNRAVIARDRRWVRRNTRGTGSTHELATQPRLAALTAAWLLC